MKDLVSIIVPVYNVVNFLDECLLSLTKQTYDAIEIIIVDDGSDDGSSELCDQWGKKDSRCKVIHKKNGGLSDARNAGLKIAKGKYFVFVDSDDYVDARFVEELHNAIVKNDADLSLCAFKEVSVSKEITKTLNLAPVTTGRELLVTALSTELWPSVVVVWNKMYKKSIFSNIQFEVGRIHEDEYFTYKVLFGCKKVAIIDRPLYYYRKDNNASITKKKMDEKRIKDIIDAFAERVSFFRDKDTELYILSTRQYFDVLMQMIAIVDMNNNSSTKKLRNELIVLFNGSSRTLTKKQHIKYYAFILAPNVFNKRMFKKHVRKNNVRQDNKRQDDKTERTVFMV